MRTPNLKLALVQRGVAWQNPEANRCIISEMIAHLQGQVDLVLLPEMFTTGFSMNVNSISECMGGDTCQWMLGQAQRGGFAIGGSIVIKEDEKFFNRFLFVTPDGTIQHYDKRHLFRMSDEHLYFANGQHRVVVNYLGWRFLPQICYDLRFPVWSRCKGDYDFILYVANFPAIRIDAWHTLLKARAIENQCFVAGVNATGQDGNRISYCGGSQVINPLGESLAATPDGECVLVVEAELNTLRNWRKKFPAQLDADGFIIAH